MSKSFNRRDFLKLAGLAGAGFALAGCAPSAATPAAGTTPAAAGNTPAAAGTTPAINKSARGFIESPMLTALVTAGKLPPIDERLPEEVFVVGPGVLVQEEFQDWQDGKHGGTINVASITQSFFLGLGGCSTVLRSPGQTSAKSLPNVVAKFSHSDDYTTFTFGLRKGLKWSDGQPVTTEDVRFPFEDMYKDPDVQYPWPTEFYNLGNSNLGVGDLKIIDDFNFELKFAKPYGQFVTMLNSWIPNYEDLFKPAHYFKRFHKKYAKPADLDAELKKANQTNWVQLITQKDVVHWDHGTAQALGMPVLNAWVLTEVNGDQRVFERNPYFWHVDKSGNQLPYVDKIINNVAADSDATVNATLAGHVDVAAERDSPINKLPVFKQNADKAGFRIYNTNSFNWPVQLFLNQDYQYDVPNSVWQTLVTDPQKRFGKAIGFAINTSDVNNSIFFGLFGDPMLTTKTYDPKQANQLLDSIGMDKRDSNNFRLGPDGKPFLFELAYAFLAAEFDPIAELLKQQLEAVGISVKLESSGTDQTAWGTKAAGNQLMASIHWNDGPAWHTAMSEDYLPAHKGPWSPATWRYFTTNGKEGRKPPDYIQKFYDLHVARKAFLPDSPEGQKSFADLLQWFDENYVLFPTTGVKVLPNLVNKNLRNTQKEGAPFELDTYLSGEGLWFAQS